MKEEGQTPRGGGGWGRRGRGGCSHPLMGLGKPPNEPESFKVPVRQPLCPPVQVAAASALPGTVGVSPSSYCMDGRQRLKGSILPEDQLKTGAPGRLLHRSNIRTQEYLTDNHLTHTHMHRDKITPARQLLLSRIHVVPSVDLGLPGGGRKAGGGRLATASPSPHPR